MEQIDFCVGDLKWCVSHRNTVHFYAVFFRISSDKHLM